MRELSGTMEIFCGWTWVVLTQAYRDVKFHQAAHLRSMHFYCVLRLNKS